MKTISAWLMIVPSLLGCNVTHPFISVDGPVAIGSREIAVGRYLACVDEEEQRILLMGAGRHYALRAQHRGRKAAVNDPWARIERLADGRWRISVYLPPNLEWFAQ